MSVSMKFEELDSFTREYLHEAKTREGKGMPGIYVRKGYLSLFLALLLGPAIALAFMIFSLGSMKDPWAIAMFQTAGLLLGSWVTLYAVRRWPSRRSTIFGGYYLYFDPLHVYDVSGETITITSIYAVQGAAFSSNGSVEFDEGFGRSTKILIPSRTDAARVESYYAAIAEIQAREAATESWEDDAIDQKKKKKQRKASYWARASAAEIGYAAKHIVENGKIPKSSADFSLDEICKIPELPRQINRPGWGILPVVVWTIATVLTYFVLLNANIPLQDGFAYYKAKEAGAPGLRAYLLDDRNILYRDGAKQQLAKIYDKAIAKIRETTPAPKQPINRQALIKILETLKTVESQPVVTLQVEAIGVPDTIREETLQTELADSLGQSIGEELVVFAAAPEEAKPNILVRFLDRNDGPHIGVDIFFRVDPDSEKPEDESHFTIKVEENEQSEGAPDQLAVHISMELTGEYRVRPIKVPDFE